MPGRSIFKSNLYLPFQWLTARLFLIFFLITNLTQPSWAMDYVISSFSPLPQSSLITWAEGPQTRAPIRACRGVFAPPSSPKIFIHRTASFSVKNGRRDDSTRGMQMHERGIEEYPGLFAPYRQWARDLWEKSGFYTSKEVARIFQKDSETAPERKSYITIESVPEGPGVMGSQLPQYFSSLRIIDSSPTMKVYGRSFRPPRRHPDDLVDMTERVFPEFNLNQTLADRGIPRANYTWNLGLANVHGNQNGAVLTLFSRAADLLDLHYNGRDHLNFGRRNRIERDDVDITFFAEAKLVPYYIQTLGLSPFVTKNGLPVEFVRGEKTFVFFHLKGSEFIQKFFDLRFHQPLFDNQNGLRNEQEIHSYYRAQLRQAEQRVKGYKPEIADMVDLTQVLRPLIYEFIFLVQNRRPHEEHFDLLSKFLILKNSIPEGLLSRQMNPTEREAMSDFLAEFASSLNFVLQGQLRLNIQGQATEKLTENAIVAFLELLLRDPVTTIINRSVKNPFQ